MRFLCPIIFALFVALLPGVAHAFTLPSGWETPICGTAGCIGPHNIVQFEAYIRDRIVTAMSVAFIGITAVMLFVYAVTLITESENESSVTQIRSGYAYAITGGALVALANYLVLAFSPNDNLTGTIFTTEPLCTGFGQVLDYFKLSLAIALLVNIVIQAILLMSAPSEEVAGRAKKQLLFGFVGVAVVLLANAIVGAVDRENTLSCFGSPSGTIIQEIVGVANFLLSIFGLLVVVALIVAGGTLVISIDETLKDKAKLIIKTTIIALAVILAAFIIVNTFLAIPL